MSRADGSKTPTTPVSPPYLEPDSSSIDDMSLWTNAWKVWLSIATTATMPPEGKLHHF